MTTDKKFKRYVIDMMIKKQHILMVPYFIYKRGNLFIYLSLNFVFM